MCPSLMPLYAFEFPVPPNTSRENPKITSQKILGEVIDFIRVVIPPGHQGLTGVRIEDASNTILPAMGSTSFWLRGDNSEFNDNQNRKFSDPPWTLRFVGYNSDDLRTHTFFIYVSITKGDKK